MQTKWTASLFCETFIHVLVYLSVTAAGQTEPAEVHCKQHTSSCSRWFNALLVGLHKKHHGCCVCQEKILTLCIRYIAGRPRQQEMKVVYWWAIQYLSFRFIYGPHDFEVIHCDLVGHWVTLLASSSVKLYLSVWGNLGRGKCTLDLVSTGGGFSSNCEWWKSYWN